MKAVLDACVLFPTVLREILLGVAARGLYQPVWSDRILREWTRATAKLGEVAVTANGVKILGVPNLPGRIAADASALYARNLFAFAGLFLDKEGKFAPDYEDEILKAALVTQGGAVVHPNLTA